MKQGPEVPAFKSKLEVHEKYSSDVDLSYIYKLKDREDLIVRSLAWEQFLGKGNFRPDWEGESISAEEFASISKKHFEELARYGVDAPVSFLVAHKEDPAGKLAEEVFAVVKNIKKNERPDKRALGEAFVSLRRSLLRYYGDKALNNSSYLADLFNDSQYVFGKAPEDQEDRLHLVDVEPFIYRGRKALLETLNSMTRVVEQERSFFEMPEYEEICEGFGALYELVRDKIPNV